MDELEVRKPASDQQVMRALSHPLRLRLYYQLQRVGSATSTMLSVDLGESAQLIHYHALQLVQAGLVQEDPSRAGKGRERFWSPTPGGVRLQSGNISDLSAKPLEALQQVQANIHIEQLTHFFESDQTNLAPMHASSDMVMELSEDELDQLQAELTEVLERWRGRPSTQVERKTLFAFYHIFPMSSFSDARHAATRNSTTGDPNTGEQKQRS